MIKKVRDVLKFWYDMECFAPEFPQKTTSITISKVGHEPLPWENRKEAQYEVYFGKISIDELVCNLKVSLGENTGIEKVSGHVCLCGIGLDSDGKYIENSFMVNPFFFAVSTVTKAKSLDVDISNDSLKKYDELFNTTMMDDFRIFTDRSDLQKIIDVVTKDFQYNYVNNHLVIINTKANANDEKEDEDADNQIEMMHSFYVQDIENIFKNVNSNDAICTYIKAFYIDNKKKKIDRDIKEMKMWMSPNRFPMGKWPSKYSPSLMQQIAINIAISDTERKKSTFSVNGPPGTGKTTLLKEIVASSIVDRAKILLSMDPQSSLTKKTLEPWPDGKAFLKDYYEIPKNISQYGIVVASNNNAAVENISLELPKAADVKSKNTHTGLFDIDLNSEIYFSNMANEILGEGKEAWGLISARLGKKANIKYLNKLLTPNFKDTFLYGHYVNNSCSWETAKSEFTIALTKVQNYRNQIEKDLNLWESLPQWLVAANEEKNKRCDSEVILSRAKDHFDMSSANLRDNEELTKITEEKKKYILEHMNFLQKLLSILGLGKYAKEIKIINDEIFNLVIKHGELNDVCNNSKHQFEVAMKGKEDAEAKELEAVSRYQRTYFAIYESEHSIVKKYGKNFADDRFYGNITENEKSQTACPWTTDEYDRLREELFYKALQMQKSFILSSDAIKKNLSMLYNFWNGIEFSEEQKRQICPHLFATLSLLVPVVSTTFASVSTFLKYIGKEEMGILIIDEAGQATPQSALGAIWRSRKAIIVGDPLQVEPIVTVPQSIIRILGKKYDIRNEYISNTLSVQDIADRINEYSGEINGSIVGCPLVIHRRCIEPMFSISNTISYGGRMFNQTNEKIEMMKDKEKFSISKSIWIDIKGSERGNRNHYVNEQGNKVIELFNNSFEKYGRDLLNLGQKKVYIISPFSSVVEEIQNKIWKIYKKHEFFEGISEEKVKKDWLQASIGTVHKFQGKEADEVFFVLGCDNNKGNGAAIWAGKKANILNVAVTRAKFRCVVIGDKQLWGNINNFNTALKLLDKNANEDLDYTKFG